MTNELVEKYAQLYNIQKIEPYSQTFEDLLYSTQYLNSFPITFNFSNSGPYNLDPDSVLDKLLNFVDEKKSIEEVKKLIFPVFSYLIIEFKKYGEDDKLEEFRKKYIDKIPEEFKEEIESAINDQACFEDLATKLTFLKYKIDCTKEGFESINEFVNRPNNTQVRYVIVNTVILQNAMFNDEKRYKTPRFITKSVTPPVAIIRGQIDNCSIAYVPRNGLYVYAAMKDQSVMQIDMLNNQSKRLYSHNSTITSLCSSSTGNILLTTDTSGCVNLYSEDRFYKLIDVSFFPVWSSKFAPVGGTFVIGHGNGLVSLYDCTELKCKRQFVGHVKPIIGLEYHPNCSLIATASTDQTIKLFDIRTSNAVRLFKSNKAYSIGPSISPDGKKLCFFNGSIRHFDISSGRLESQIELAEGGCNVFYTSDSSHIVFVGKKGCIRLCDISSENCTHTEIINMNERVVFSSINPLNEIKVIISN